MEYEVKLEKLRKLMAEDGVAALIISTADPHQSSSIAEHWKAVKWFTGFTGSLGTCVVTMDKVGFWTDGRYNLQAERELDGKGIEQYVVNTFGQPTMIEWILSNTQVGDTVALDGRVLGICEFRELEHDLAGKQLKVACEKDYPGMVWEGREPIPTEPLFEYDFKFCGMDRPAKLAKIRECMAQKGADYYFAAGLDDIAWMTNLRGRDNPLMPIFHAYLLLSQDFAKLFVGLNKVTGELRTKLERDGYTLHEMDEMPIEIKKLPENKVFYMDPYKIGLLVYSVLPAGTRVVEGMDILEFQKSMKNSAEIASMKLACEYESVALARLIKYIKDNAASTTLNEWAVGSHLEVERKKFPSYFSPGNVPIVAYMENAALAHYRPTAESSAAILPKGFFLFDVCAQFYEGTTDVTRTVVVGELTDEMIRDYTICLKSHIALATQKFPYGTTGPHLDAIVKSHHWNNGLHYSHGTGHGIGCMLSIHEGPMRVGTTPSPTVPYGRELVLEPGMIVSNEPGIYKGGRYGIRLENDILFVEAETNEFARFLAVETLTFIPFDLEAVDSSLLSDREREWLNDYHSAVYEKLSKYMDEEEKAWLRQQTRAI